MTDKELAELRARNAARAAEVIKQMGERWCCHPDYRGYRPQSATRALVIDEARVLTFPAKGVYR